ncbi:MAG: hypothetical protein IT431_16010 [Phycisphaerales bacterium]|nr:hypothetical protein [Phycisphaerales bacterium]
MPMIEIKSEPSTTELRVFAALWLVFWVVLGRIVVPAGHGVLVGAGVTGGCFLISLLLNRDMERGERWWGVCFPLGLFALWAIGRGAAALPDTVLVGCAGVGLAGAGLTLASRPRGAALYRAWMLGAMPIGWVLSHAMMLAVFYGVVTPVGLLVRAAGRDPMTRRFDRSAGSYWVKHEPGADPGRYFKQS